MRNKADYAMMQILPKQLISLRGWRSQAWAAKRLGVRRPTISDWETGKGLPSLGLFFQYLYILASEKYFWRAVEECTVECTLPGGVGCRITFSKPG